MFIHGLEGHPEGAKVVKLRAQGFEVCAADMHMSQWQLGKRNSIVRNVLRARDLRLAVVGLVVGLGASVVLARPLPLLVAAVAAVGWIGLRREQLVVEGIRRSFNACVAIQADALARYAPDIIVGSSWGGAVAAELRIRGVWSGPTILLAPAIRRVSMRAKRTDPSEALAQLARVERPILVFHDPSDDVVPHADSVDLGEAPGIELRSVDAGGHRLLGLLDSGELGEAIRACADAGQG